MFIGSISILASGILFGLIPLITVNLYASGLNTLTVSFYRYLFVLPIVLILNIFKKESFKLDKGQAFKLVTRLGVVSVLTSLLLTGSYNFISTGMATTLHFLYPVVVIVLCVFYYHEKLSKEIIVAVILVLIGVICFAGEFSGSFIGIAMAAISSLTYSIYILQLERTRLNRLAPTVLSFYLSIVQIVLLVLVSLFIEPIHFSINLNQLFYFVLLGATTLAAQALFQFGSRYLGSKLSALLSLSEPVTSMVIGIFFLNEKLVFLKIVGSILILLAILLVTFRKKEPSDSLKE